MNGKEKCELLKKTRVKIAEANNIPYVPEECNHKGDCPGTCPVCEKELEYLTYAIEQLKKQGKKVVLEDLTAEIISASNEYNNENESAARKRENSESKVNPSLIPDLSIATTGIVCPPPVWELPFSLIDIFTENKVSKKSNIEALDVLIKAFDSNVDYMEQELEDNTSKLKILKVKIKTTKEVRQFAIEYKRKLINDKK